MDAALDTMLQYGFNLKVVRRTIQELLKTLLEFLDGAGTSAARDLMVFDIPEPLLSRPSKGPLERNRGSSSQPRLEESTQPAEPHRYPRHNRRSRYAERVRNIMGVKRSDNYREDPPCKRRFCYGYLGEGEQDDLFKVKQRPNALASLPVSLLLSHGKQKQSTNPGLSRPPFYRPIPRPKR
ncbi:hypothetical protein MLD38_008699 [Melastoma candidum]|uniref:Uncharacterized protein n=1 Tax=Melastoma candidum TaxID=119954 RepID=A0ACB9RUS8_9MYRT|nr:hypothetical protein MLD38_008699 [Melastoma candidum]